MSKERQPKRQDPPPDPTCPRLALRPREAAKALGIGERLLWSKTNSGEIPCIRIGRAIVYPVELLCEWLRAQAKQRGGNHQRKSLAPGA